MIPTEDRSSLAPVLPRLSCVGLLAASALALAACGGSDPEPTPPLPVSTACEAAAGGSTVVVGSGLPGDPALPEPSSGYRLGIAPVLSKSYMVVTANPLATKAGCDVLKAGGSAADAAVAVQMVLGLVEPQSSGLGGGAFVVYYDAATKTVQTYDGRETAPAAATENYLRWVSDTDTTAPLPNARRSGRSIGTPGTVRVLSMLHTEHGSQPWAGLFDAGIQLATDGFPISGRMADAIAGARADLLRDPDAVAYFLKSDLSRQGPGRDDPEPGLRGHAVAHRDRRRRRVLHRRHRRGHRHRDRARRVRLRRAGTADAGPDHAGRHVRLRRQEARPGLHRLPRLPGLRHGAAVVGRASR